MTNPDENPLPSRRQWVFTGLFVLLLLVLGTILEGGPTPEVADTLARIKVAFAKFTRGPSDRPLFPAEAVAAATRDMTRYAHDKSPDGQDALAQIYLRRFLAHMREHSPALAEQDLDAAILLNSSKDTKTESLQIRATLRAACDHNYAGALADTDGVARLQKLDGNDSKTDYALSNYLQRAFIYGAMGRYDRAIAYQNKAIAIMLQEESGVIGLAKSPGTSSPVYDKEISKFKRRFDRSLARVYKARGYWEQRLGRDDAALADFNTAIGLAPDLPDAYNGRARLYLSQGRIGSALADYWHRWKIGSLFPRRNFCVR